MRYHDLRHEPLPSWLPRVFPQVAREILGHAQITTTMNIYTHIAPSCKRMLLRGFRPLCGLTACPRRCHNGCQRQNIKIPEA